MQSSAQPTAIAVHRQVTLIMLAWLATACAVGHRNNTLARSDDTTTQNTVEYRDSTDYADAAAWMRSEQQLELFSSMLDSEGAHPAVTFVAEDCGAVNAFYQPATRTLRLCYELVALVMEQHGTTRTAHHIVGFVLGHELAHAYIDLFNLPVIGREEDAADQLAALHRLLPPSEGDYDSRMEYANGVVAAAQFFRGEQMASPVWGEHSMGDARYYNLLCITYGAIKELREPIATLLPAQRAERCEAEYRQAINSWDRLMYNGRR